MGCQSLGVFRFYEMLLKNFLGNTMAAGNFAANSLGARSAVVRESRKISLNLQFLCDILIKIVKKE